MAEDADDRTEAASPRRLQQARDAGQSAVSREPGVLLVLAGFAALLSASGPSLATGVLRRMAGLLSQLDSADPLAALWSAMQATALAAGPFLILAVLAAALATLAQTGGLLHLGGLMPDFARLDPRRGLQRVISVNALYELAKSLLKIGVSALCLWLVLRGAVRGLGDTLVWHPARLLGATSSLVGRVLFALLGAYAAIAAADLVRVRLSRMAQLRMTRQEVREEMKEMEGDPHVKGRIRKLRLQRTRRRMLQAVPTATVVVTNPTHYAVALAYDRGSTAAPRVVAKGVDAMAARIRDLAREHRVPMVANPALARALYPVELDAEIPPELFQAVAEIIAYILGLRRPRL